MNIKKINNFKRVYLGIFFFYMLGTAIQANHSIEYGFMWYNVENLFDTYNDSTTLDDEFTPFGMRHWTYNKYQMKLRNVAVVSTEIDDGKLPTFIALCEIENRRVLLDLNRKFYHYRYNIVHYDSPDKRGIDLGLLYQKTHFSVDTAYPIHVELPNHHPTRDILYIKGKLVRSSESLHLFLIHAPSKRGGVKNSDKNRMVCLDTLYNALLDIIKKEPDSEILVVGDFNAQYDEPPMLNFINNVSRFQIRRAVDTIGTQSYFYHGKWGSIDHLFYRETIDSLVKISGFKVYDASFLKKYSNKDLDSIPWRTYNYLKYLNGYSDHFPLFFTINIMF